MDENPHEGPDAGGKIDRAVMHHRSPAGRPHGDQSFIPQHLILGRPSAKAPQGLTRFRVQAVEIAIIGNEVEFPLPTHRSEAHRAARIEAPLLVAGFGIEGPHVVAYHGGHEDQLGHHHRFIAEIEL